MPLALQSDPRSRWRHRLGHDRDGHEQPVHFHWNRLIEDLNPARPVVTQFLDSQTSRFEALIPGDSSVAVVKMLAKLAQREALVLTYNDLLLLIGALFVFGLILLPLVRPTRSFFSR